MCHWAAHLNGLYAPTSGTYNDILFFQNISDTNQATFQNSVINGVMYFPGANVVMQGTSTVSGGIVVNTITLQSDSVTTVSMSGLNGLPQVTLVQ